MLATEHTQSLTDFQENTTETLERLNRTGEAEILTVNGEVRAVMLSPTAYDEITREVQLSRDVEVMRKSLAQIEAGKFSDVDTVFDRLHAKLLAMQAKQENITT